MKRFHLTLLVLILTTVSFCGCTPRRVFWSPQGKHAALITRDGLRLCDAEGRLSEPVADHPELVVWLPDGRRFIAARSESVDTWEEATEVLPPERRELLLKLAEPLKAELIAFADDLDDYQPSILSKITTGEFRALLLYLHEQRDELPDELREKLKAEDKEPAAPIHILQIYEMNDLAATPGRVLTRSLDEFYELRLSPDGRTLACVQSVLGGQSMMRLSVMDLQEGTLQLVAEQTTAFPDWSADGTSLTYAIPVINVPHVFSEDNDLSGIPDPHLQMGLLYQRQVRDSSGEILHSLADPEMLLACLVWSHMKIRCLHDGRILFSGWEVALPTRVDSTWNDEISKRVPLLWLEQSAETSAGPDDKTIAISHVVSPDKKDQLPEGFQMGLFELSPDQRRLLVTDQDGKTAILDLATQKVTPVLMGVDFEPVGLPAWRSSETISLFVPRNHPWTKTNRQELVLWSGPDQVRCLSCDWPELFPEEENQPRMVTTTRPAGD